MRAERPQSAASPRKSDASAPNVPAGGALTRIGWMAVAPIAIVMATLQIASTPHWTFGLTDLTLVAGAVLAIACRYWDIRAFDGQTANGEPASMPLFWRYSVALSGIVAACWLAAQSVHI